jgi:hypothetical protein
MAGRCNTRSPLTRAGTTQGGRDAAELDPGFFGIDERETPDLILTAARLSQEVIRYGETGGDAGDWQPFFTTDAAAALSALARLPVTEARAAFADLQEFLTSDPDRPPAEMESQLRILFHLPVGLVAAFGTALSRLARDHPLRGRLEALVAAEMGGPLDTLVAFYKGAIGAGLPFAADTAVDPGDLGTGAPGDVRPPLSRTVAALVVGAGPLTTRPLPASVTAPLGTPDWAGFTVDVTGDAAPWQQAASLYGQVYDVLTYNLLVDDLERLFRAVERAAIAATSALETRLAGAIPAGEEPTPDYALFLAFLAMLDPAREALNGLTGRHLDFYLRDVLRLAPRPAAPQSVIVHPELARGTNAHLLGTGTALKAGKDASGAEALFATTDDLVVNRGQLTDLRAVRLHRTVQGGSSYDTAFAAAVVNSLDGLGAELPDATTGWRPFGPRPWRADGTPALPFARVGFAVADRRLFCREGTRSIRLNLQFDTPVGGGLRAAIRVRLTGPEGWFETAATLKTFFSVPRYGQLWFTLDGDAPEIVPFDPALHSDAEGAGYAPGLPVAEYRFDFDGETDQTACAFARLRAARVETVNLRVSASGLRRFTAQSDDGTLDLSKPSPAFGARPKAGAALILGSAEIFAKPLDRLYVRPEWQETYSSGAWFLGAPASDYTADVAYLKGGAWAGASAQANLRITATTPTRRRLADIDIAPGDGPMMLEDPPFRPDSRAGYLRLKLRNGFGHERHMSEQTRAMVSMANPWSAAFIENGAFNYREEPDGSKLPRDPFTPTLTALTLSYRTQAGPPATFYHVCPYGVAARASEDSPLLPPLDHEAALYLGIDGFEAPARLTLHVQVASGTGDPLLSLPVLAVHALAADDWVALAPQAVDDKTGGFAASAIMGLAVPREANRDHSVLPGGRHWLRLSVPDRAAALNDILSITAQAVRATHLTPEADPIFAASPLPPGTIKKLASPDPAIKGAAQPYAGFGGRAEEGTAAFRRRAAERLRHKDRASTMWDYERLVLEAIPGIYRVKCLHHTEFQREAGAVVAENELKPGGVVVVTVPWTVGRPHLDPLRPFTDQATLGQVDKLLRSRVSPFVRLEIANPRFEEVRMTFDMAFHDDVADVAFYLAEVDRAVTEYLAPWSSGSGADITFGGTLRKSSVIDFVEELPYVDYLQNVTMAHRPDASMPWAPMDLETVTATTARSILVSAAKHIIAEVGT